MEPLLIDKIVNRIEARGGFASKREISAIRRELDKLACEIIHWRLSGCLPEGFQVAQ